MNEAPVRSHDLQAMVARENNSLGENTTPQILETPAAHDSDRDAAIAGKIVKNFDHLRRKRYTSRGIGDGRDGPVEIQRDENGRSLAGQIIQYMKMLQKIDGHATSNNICRC